MGVEEIKKEILEEARAEAKRILADAGKQALQTLSEAKKQAEAREAEFEKELAADLQALGNREIASAEFGARRILMVRRKELLDSFFAACMEAAASLPVKRRQLHIRMLVEQAARDFPVSAVYTRSDDAFALPGAESHSLEMKGGVIIENSEGTQRIDLSYESLIKDLFAQSLPKITATLFGE